MKTKSNITEKKLTKAELEAREKIINNLKKNKSSLVKRYGKDAEAVMYGRATNIVKKMTKTNTQNNLKELVRKSLMQEADIEVTADRYGEEKALGQAAMMLDVLEDKLKKHDWFYMMSDDNRKYKEGTTQQIEIRKIIKQLEDIGYGDDAKKLFNQYAPDGPDGSTLKIKEGKKEFPDLTILKGRGVKLKEEYTEEVDTLALTIKDPNEFEKAKQHFESNSDFYPFDINDEFRTFYFQVQDQADADSTEFYLTQELEGETDLQGYYFSIETSPLSEDLDLGHEDNEPHMLKGDLYRIGKYAMELYQMVDGFEGKGEVDFPHWWQSKIVKAKDILISAKHYLDFELKEPAIDAMVDTLTGEEPHEGEPVPPMMENIGKDEILAGRLYKIKNFVQPAFYQKVRMMINNGDLEKAEEFISRMEPVSAKKDTEFAAMKGELDSLEEVKDKIAKKLKEGLPKGFFKKEFGIGDKKKTVKEDWDSCIAKVTDQGKSQKAAEKICGAINAAYVGNYRQ